MCACDCVYEHTRLPDNFNWKSFSISIYIYLTYGYKETCIHVWPAKIIYFFSSSHSTRSPFTRKDMSHLYRSWLASYPLSSCFFSPELVIYRTSNVSKFFTSNSLKVSPPFLNNQYVQVSHCQHSHLPIETQILINSYANDMKIHQNIKAIIH